MKKTFRKVTFDIVVCSKDNKEAIEKIEHQLHMSSCPVCSNEIGEYIHYSRYSQALAVREMEFDKERGEWAPIGNGGD